MGMEEWLYRDLESCAFHRSYTLELADKLAAIYGIPVEGLLPDPAGPGTGAGDGGRFSRRGAGL